MAERTYTLTFECHNTKRGIAPSQVISKRFRRTVRATNHNEAWGKGQKIGGQYNRTHKRKCVLYGVATR